MKFCCVLVTFNPDINYFTEVLKSIQINNPDFIVIVDNGSSNYSDIKRVSDEKSAVFIPLNSNVGIAKAQNIGIKWAKSNNIDYIWLSDQDTIYKSDFLYKMKAKILMLLDENVNFAVLAPSFLELNRKKIQPFFKVSLFTKQFLPEPGFNEVSHLIASGMIVPLSVLDQIGYMREDLFIDWVDLEWCWRARKSNLKVIGVGDVQIEHNLGDEMVSLIDKKISIRSSFRHYFIIRNGVYLSLYSDLLPCAIRVEYFFRAIAFSILYPMLAKTDKLAHLKACFTGFCDGLFGRLGPKN